MEENDIGMTNEYLESVFSSVSEKAVDHCWKGFTTLSSDEIRIERQNESIVYRTILGNCSRIKNSVVFLNGSDVKHSEIFC